ncbi:Hypothetical predicted protein [Pelobates cultripes]|uniref:Uncharacterized protein n=1 Tax=Pelobates cultripes TaxID=61616 RepID=A0AAD1RUT8_PELCU|nr:Hypothetical predicted protein [Pelobates cultripes]
MGPSLVLTPDLWTVSSTCRLEHVAALNRIGEELRNMAATMATKADLQLPTSTIQEAVRVASLRTEVTAQEGRIHTLDYLAEAQSAHIAASGLAVACQGGMPLAMRRHVEDLDNRGQRCNIRVRGVPEVEGEENAVYSGFSYLTLLEFERPRMDDHLLRDLICCMHSFQIKDTIMKRAWDRSTWEYRRTQVALYNDLSPLTLEARRALRPMTATLRDHIIRYKWGFPFTLLSQHQHGWASLRWPEDIPQFLEEKQPSTNVTNWVLGPLEQRPQLPDAVEVLLLRPYAPTASGSSCPRGVFRVDFTCLDPPTPS